MKRILLFLVLILIGISMGWYLGYNQLSVKKQRELPKSNHQVQDSLHLTDQQIADFGSNVPQYFEDVKRQDERAAVVALGAFKYLERGDTNAAKQHLAWRVGSYYRLYHKKGGDTNVLAKIEAAAREYPAIAEEISKQIE